MIKRKEISYIGIDATTLCSKITMYKGRVMILSYGTISTSAPTSSVPCQAFVAQTKLLSLYHKPGIFFHICIYICNIR
jgi:hypothetical protein